MNEKLKKTIGAMAAAVCMCIMCVPVQAYAKSAPKLSVDQYSVKTMTGEKNYTISLKGAGKNKVKWTVKTDKGFDGPILKVVKKNKKKIVVTPLKNGTGTIVCKVGKKRLQCSYDVYLKEKTEAEDKNLSNDELYKKFLNNEIPALYDLYEDYDYETDTYTTTIKDGGWYYFASLDDSYGGYHVAEKTDLDNDGENELVLEYRDWPEYCRRFIDASDGVVHELAAGEGTGEWLSYTNYDGAVWIVTSDSSHAQRQYFLLEKYQGYGDPVEMISLSWEDNEDNGDSGSDVYDESDIYMLNDKAITMDEYEDYVRKLGFSDQLRDENDDY